MTTLKKYEVGDWMRIPDAMEPFIPGSVTEATEHGLAVSAEEDGNMMLCGGIAFVDDEEGVVWVKVSKKCLKEPVKWGRTLKEAFVLMSKITEDMKLVTYVVKDFCKGDRLARLIGMKPTDETREFNGNIYCKYEVS